MKLEFEIFKKGNDIHISYFFHSANVPGRWIFNVTETDDTWVKKSECLGLVEDSNYKSIFSNAGRYSQPCPCSFLQAWSDRRFR